MVRPLHSFQIETKCSPVICERSYSNSVTLNCKWTWPTTHKLMVKQSELTNVLGVIFDVLLVLAQQNGETGYHWLTSTTLATIHLWKELHLKHYMVMNLNTLELIIYKIVQLLIWSTGWLNIIWWNNCCSNSWFMFNNVRNVKLTWTRQRDNFKWVNQSLSNSNLMCKPVWLRELIRSCHFDILVPFL